MQPRNNGHPLPGRAGKKKGDVQRKSETIFSTDCKPGRLLRKEVQARKGREGEKEKILKGFLTFKSGQAWNTKSSLKILKKKKQGRLR